MPLLNVAVTGTADPERSAAIAARLTALTEKYLGKDPALTAITIRNVDPDHWFVGSKAVGGRNANSFSLQISVTEGTNTKSQIADYIEAVYSSMSELLGSVCDESYIVVDNVPAASWGYAGRTQEFRYINGLTS